ncbi:MAG: recombinase family protein [Thermoplasmata archaeon]
MTRAAVYARVSTSEQSCDAQVEQLEQLARVQGWDPVVFRDDGVSGILDNRPQLDLLRERMRAGEFHAVLVTKLDRLGRSIAGVHRFWEEADLARVRVIVADQGFDSSSPTGRLMRDMLSAIAVFERELILERTKAGVDRARRAGKKFGRPRTVPEDVRELIRERAASGQKPREISIALKVKASTVRSILASAKSPPRVLAGPSPSVDPPPA